MFKFQIILFLVIFASCLERVQTISSGLTRNDIDEIINLKTDEQKSKFLSDLWKEDQSVRTGAYGELLVKHGAESDELQTFMENWKKVDREIFAKMKLYLETHGYPTNIDNYEQYAVNSFPTIIGHNHNFKAQRELLLYLYDAYKAKHCSLDDIVWILGEMYEAKHSGNRYKMKSNRFTTEQEFLELQEALGLNLEL